MAVPGGGINEELPVACACVAENALLHDGTAQCEVLREGATRTSRPIALQKMPNPVVVSVLGRGFVSRSSDTGPVGVAQALQAIADRRRAFMSFFANRPRFEQTR
jgi:hypothetical protein